MDTFVVQAVECKTAILHDDYTYIESSLRALAHHVAGIQTPGKTDTATNNYKQLQLMLHWCRLCVPGP